MSEFITNDTLSDLHQKKQNAIDALDFETAEYYYNEIQNRISQRAQSQIDEIHYETIRQLQIIQRVHKQLLEDLVEEKRKSDARLYTKYQVLFEQTQDDHIEQLMNLEKDRGITLLEESEREIPEQIELLNRAKQEAFLSRFEKAKQLRQEARDFGEAELERRRVDVEKRFQDLKDKMLVRHQKEMNEITELHEEEIKKLKESSDFQNQEAKRKLREEVDLLKDRATVRIKAVTANDLTKKAGIDTLMNEIDNSMKEYNLMPTIVPKLTKSEQMRLTTLCPTNAAMNSISGNTEEVVKRALTATTAKRTYRTGLKHPTHNSTRLLTRAYTATVGKR